MSSHRASPSSTIRPPERLSDPHIAARRPASSPSPRHFGYRSQVTLSSLRSSSPSHIVGDNLHHHHLYSPLSSSRVSPQHYGTGTQYAQPASSSSSGSINSINSSNHNVNANVNMPSAAMERRVELLNRMGIQRLPPLTRMSGQGCHSSADALGDLQQPMGNLRIDIRQRSNSFDAIVPGDSHASLPENDASPEHHFEPRRAMTMPAKKCHNCTDETVWVIPGKQCPRCGTYISDD